MNDVREFLRSVRADLIERRLWPILLLLVIGGVAAVVLLGGKGSAIAPSSTPPAATAGLGATGPELSPVPPSANLAVAETANGVAFQRQGAAHDPFTPLVLPSAATGPTGTSGAQGSSTSTSSTSSSTSSAGSGSGSGGTSVPTPSVPTPSVPTPSAPTPTPTPSAPKKSSKPTTLNADFHFGLLPASATTGATGPTGPTGPAGSTGTTGPSVPLTDLQDYSQPKTKTDLPDSVNPILRLTGVGSGGASLRFSVLQELFISGPGTCLPSATDCQTLDLQPGDVETFQYDSSTLGFVEYQLVVVSVNGHTAGTTATVRHDARQSPSLGVQIVSGAGPIQGQPVPLPLSRTQLAKLVLSRGSLGPAPQLAGVLG